MTIEELKVLITAETSGIKQEINKVQKQLDGFEKKVSKSTKRINSAFKSLFKGVSFAAITLGLIKFGKSAINTASQLEEIQNVVDVVFKHSADEINQFAGSAIESFGLSELAAKRMASTFMAMANGMGINHETGKEMSKTLTGLAGDMASFYNVSADVAETALHSVFTGETESLKRFGIVLTEANLQQFAYSQGINRQISEMSQAEKVLLRYQYVLQATGQAQGDFARTSGTWANQTRILRQEWETLKGTLGSFLIKILLPIVKAMNKLLGLVISVANAIAKAFGGEGIKKITGSVEDGLGSLDDSSNNLGGNFDDATESAKKLKRTISGFDELNVLNDASGSGAASSGGANLGGDLGSSITGTADMTPTVDNEKGQSRIEAFLENMNQSIKDWVVETIYVPLDIDPDSYEQMSKKLKDFLKKFAAIALAGLAGLFGAAKLMALYFDEDMFYILKTFPSHWGAINDVAAMKIFGIWDRLILKLRILFGRFKKTPLIPLPSTDLAPYTSKFEAFKTKVAEFGKGLLDVLLHPFTAIKTLFINAGAALGKLWHIMTFNPVTTVIVLITLLITSLVSLYKRSEAFRDMIKDFYNGTILPFVQGVKDAFNGLIKDHLMPLIKNLFGEGGAGRLVIDFIQNVWDLVSSVIGYLTITVAPILVDFFGGIVKTCADAIGTILDIINDIADVFNGVIKFLTGVFSGDWKKALEGLKEILEGILDGIIDVIKLPINIVIGLINGLLSGVVKAFNSIKKIINSLHVHVPDWIPLFGGKEIGFNLKMSTYTPLPLLANGGVITSPTVAMMGEYPGANNNPEIAAPQSVLKGTMEEANSGVINAIFAMGSKVAKAVEDKSTDVYLDRAKVSRDISREQEYQRKNHGSSLVFV